MIQQALAEVDQGGRMEHLVPQLPVESEVPAGMVTEQFDSNPDSRDKAEQVRAMDLMARKAYFSSRWQVETGSYLMLAGAVLFVFLQRLVAGNEKPSRSWLPGRPDIASEKKSNRSYLLISAGSIIVVAIRRS